MKKNRNVYITCMHTTHNASERVQKSQFDVWQLKWHNREREREKEFMNINQKMLQQQIIMQKEYDWHKIN